MPRHPRTRSLDPLSVPRVAALLPALVVVAIIGWQVQLIGDYQVDDAYISFAFAKNLASGHGLTYGAGLRVEGYSNFLWTVVAALVQLILPDHIYLGMQAVALACLGITLVYTFRLSARVAGTRWAWLPVLLLAFATDLTGAALSALETVAYTAALLLTVYCYLTEDGAKRRHSAWCFLLMALVRIDGIVHIAFFLGWTGLLWLLERRRPRIRETVHWLLVPALLYAAYFVWRYSYYGLPLPTTYYAKSLIHEALPNRGREYVVAASNQLGFTVVGLFALFAVIRRRTRARWMIASLVLFHLAYVSHVGGDWMPFHRFLVPVLPLMDVLTGWGMWEVWRLPRRTFWPIRATVGTGLLACAAYIATLQDGHSLDTPEEQGERDMRLLVAQHTKGLVEARRLFQWVTRRPGEKFVTDYGGVMAYYTDASIIEMWGLCNADIALRGDANGINPIYGKTCIECYRAFQPDYFHANVPLIRPASALKNQREVVENIFQGQALDSVLDFRRNFVTGRVVDRAGLAFYFIERRRAGLSFEPRHPAPGIVVEYPFL